ncbi:MAG: ABC transporter substrate-binding protein [Leucobacter sp.]
MTMHRKRALAAISAATLAGFLLTGCTAAGGAGDGEASGDAAPIRIGAISSITGPAPFPEVPAAAQAVFDRVNAEGGIDGRMIEFISEDDGADPAQASQAARRLVDENEVVAMVGSASLVECSANAAFYAQRGIVSLTGTGVEPTCFESANIAPVNNGTIQGYASLLYFASEELGHDRVCPVILNSAGLTDPYLDLIDGWKAETGSEPPLVDTTVNLGDDVTPVLLAVRDAGCEAVVFNSNEPVATAFMNTAKQQDVLDGVDYLTLTSAYSEAVVDTLDEQGTLGLYANSEFVPFIGDDPELEEWRTTLTEAEVPLTSLSQGGYVAAEIMVEALRGIDGEITPEAVRQALLDAGEIENPLLGMPFVFTDADAHNPNRASLMVQATEDGWVTASDWVVVP